MDRSQTNLSTRCKGRGRGRGRGRGTGTHTNKLEFGRNCFRSPARGRNAYRTFHNDMRRNSRWVRPPSPVEGSEEFLDRKIRETSAKIMRHLLSPSESMSGNTKCNESYGHSSQSETVPITKDNTNSIAEKATSDKAITKTKKTSNPHISAEQIYEKIMNHIANLNDGRKKNFIYANNSTGLNQALTDIQKQNRLEISKILRDMNYSRAIRNCEDNESSIVPDIGIKLEELPASVIEELKITLNNDLLSLIEAIDEPRPINRRSPTRPSVNCVASGQPEEALLNSSTELQAAIDSIQIKHEEIDAAENHIVSNSQGGVEAEGPDQVSYRQSCEPVPSFSPVGDSCGPVDDSCGPVDDSCGPIGDISRPVDASYELVEIKVEAEDNNIADLGLTANEPLNIEKTPDFEISPTELLNDADFLDNTETTINFPSDPNDEIINHHQQETDITNSTDTTDNVSSRNEPGDLLRHLENNIFQTLATDRTTNSIEIETVIDKVESLDICIQHLESYKKFLIRKILSLSRGTQSSPASHSTLCHNRHSCSNTTQPSTVAKIASKPTLLDVDNRILKKRKTAVNKQINSKPLQDPDTSHVKVEQDVEVLLNLSFQDGITCVEKVDKYLVLATETGNIIYVNLHDSSLEYTLDVTQSPITSMNFVNGLNEFIYMYVGCLDEVLRIYDFKGRKLIQASQICDQIRCMDYMWDYLFMGCKNGSLIRYSCNKGRVEFEEKKLGADILVVKAAQEGPRRVLLVGHRNAPIYVRDAMSGLCLRNFSNEAVAPTVYSLLINGSNLYCGTARNNILVFSFHEGKLVNSIIADRAKGISCMRIKDSHLFVGCYNGSIYIYNLDDNKLIKTLKGPGGGIRCMEVLSKQIIVGTLSGQFTSLIWPHGES